MIGTLIAYAFWAGLVVVLVQGLRAQFERESDLARHERQRDAMGRAVAGAFDAAQSADHDVTDGEPHE